MEKLTLQKEIKNCCGCATCENACPKNAIHMENNSMGFPYPVIDTNLCIDCKHCLDICPENNSKIKSDNTHYLKPHSYAAWVLNEKILKESSSGGIFTPLATQIIKQQGCVFGAHLDETLNVSHIKVDTIEDLLKLRGSKYTPSHINLAYRDVKNELKKGRQVLFSGVPCQIGGLKAYLGKDYPNLYCIDIICHGVPAKTLLDKYISHLEKKYKSSAKNIFFRDKRSGWKNYSITVKFENKKVFSVFPRKDLFMRGFLRDICLRESCYNCSYKVLPKLSDITLGDFWGIDRYYPEISHDKGISLVFIHSEKGQELYTKIADQVESHTVEYEKSIISNPSFLKTPTKPQDFDTIVKEIISQPIKDTIDKRCPIQYRWTPLKNKIIGKIKSMIKK